MKFGRKYKLTIQTQDGGELIVTQPCTIQFNINRSVAASINTMQLQIYNLGISDRNAIFKDRFSTNVHRKVILQAGYDDLSTVFIGDIWESNSSRQGNNVITNIVARDGGFDTYNERVALTLKRGTSVKELLTVLSNKFPNLKQQFIGNFPGTLARGVTVEGNLYQQLRAYSQNQVFIDLGNINILQNNEVFQAVLPIISADTGLLDTPKRDNSYLTVNMLFEPRIVMGQIILLKSLILPQYDGAYKVMSVNHSGIISDAVNGKCVSTFALWNPSQIYNSTVTVG